MGSCLKGVIFGMNKHEPFKGDFEEKNKKSKQEKSADDMKEKEYTSILEGERDYNMENMGEKEEQQKSEEERTEMDEEVDKEDSEGPENIFERAERKEGGDQETLEEIRESMEALKKEKEELMNKMIRLQADFDNYRKRMKTEKEELVKHVNFEFIKKILPVIDNMERALASAEKKSDGVVEGLEMILRQFKEVLESEGVVPVESIGKVFDPALHEAVMTEENEEYPPGTVIEELQRGYKMENRILRPSMVKVSEEKKISSEEAEKAEEDDIE